MRPVYFYISSIIWLILTSCGEIRESDPDLDALLRNANSANEGFRRCIAYTDAWLSQADSATGLIPRNIVADKDIWNAQDAAADNYPFMVLTSAILDRDMYRGRMLDMLRTETQLTSRVGTLPDTWSFSKNGFLKDTIEINHIIFGTSEYMKDGLLPLMEYLGNTPWSDRMLGMLEELQKHVEVVTDQWDSFGPAPRDEVNGELLQVLSRVYWMTGNRRYLKWAYKIGDYYLNNENLPTRQNYLRLRDHGCEIISGLCELYVMTSSLDQNKKKSYQPFLFQMLDRILEAGRNESGLFYNAIDPVSGKILDENLADTWGYTLNGYYSVYQVDSIERYKKAVEKALRNVTSVKSYAWEGESADGYADAIEGALNLYQRMPADALANWIDSEIEIMWDKQQENGIIEGWHGDGNFARTTLMYALWKTMGLTLDPWKPDVVFSAIVRDSKLKFIIKSDHSWQGVLKFDFPRHARVLNLPFDYPRINQFPEWFTVSPEFAYTIKEIGSNTTIRYTGLELIEGIQLEVYAGEIMVFELSEE